MSPSPLSHRPAIALNNELFPEPLAPVIKRLAPGGRSREREGIRVRERSGVKTVREERERIECWVGVKDVVILLAE